MTDANNNTGPRVSRHHIAVNLFPKLPTDDGYRTTSCEYDQYIEHVVGEYVVPCDAKVKDRRNLSVRIGDDGPFNDFSICDHHAEEIEKRLNPEDGAVVGAGEVEEQEPAEVANA